MGKYIKPTEKEFEILSVLWQEGAATVKLVHEKLASKTGYTTTLKLMQIMFEKGIVKRDTTTKQHIYKANYTKDQAKEYKVKQMLLELFDADKEDTHRILIGSAYHKFLGLPIAIFITQLKSYQNFMRVLYSPYLKRT